MLRTPDMWTGFAERYLTALDQLASGERRSPESRRDYDVYTRSGSTYASDHRADRLADWHQTPFDRLAGGPEEGLPDRLVNHPALGGPELALLRARLARQRGDTATARELAIDGLRRLRGHQELIHFANEIGAELPRR
jgi:hypothetical protein